MTEPRDWNEHYATGNTPWDSGNPSLEMQRVIEECEITPRRTLEIGCGTGTNALWLAEQGFEGPSRSARARTPCPQRSHLSLLV